jgi:hypothetical protein
MSVKDAQTSPWIIDVARTAYREGFRRALEGAGRLRGASDIARADACFERWWDKAAGPEACGLVPVMSEALVLEPSVDSPGGTDEGHRHDDEKDGL